MADSGLQVASPGGQAKVDYRSEASNGDLRQVVVLGDPATNAGVAAVDATNGLSVTLTTAIPEGSAAIGKLAANAGVNIGDVINIPTTSGGYSLVRSINFGPTGLSVKGSAGQVYAWDFYNNSASALFFKLYNKATAPDENDTPVITIPLAANSRAALSFPHGIAFATGIGIRATTAVADNSTAGPGANEAIFSLYYK